ncbi:hypothetical protein Tco_0235895 [Tanacetum coccineum]
MEVVVAATVAAAATAVVHGGCDGGDFGEVERRQGGGVRMMMMATVVVGGCGVGLMKVAVIGRNPAGTRERRRKILDREKYDVVKVAAVVAWCSVGDDSGCEMKVEVVAGKWPDSGDGA